MYVITKQNSPRYLILILLCISCTLTTVYGEKEEGYSRVTRAVGLAVEVSNGVPYLELGSLCETEVESLYEGGREVLEWPEDGQSQFQEIANFYESHSLKVLLDTGSTQFWLADSSCSTCPQARPLCPHLPTPNRKITYIKGSIEGIDSYINLCGNRVKFLCVKNMEGMGAIKGQGILGLRDGSVGRAVLFGILRRGAGGEMGAEREDGVRERRRRQGEGEWLVQRYEIRFQMGSFRSSVQILHSRTLRWQQPDDEQPQQSIPQITSTKNWSFQVQSLSFFNNDPLPSSSSIPQPPILAHIDTGSSKLVLSFNLCLNFLKQLKQKESLLCRYTQDQGIDCDRIVRGVNMQLRVGEGVVLRVQDRYLIDGFSNRLQILCQPPSQDPQHQQQTLILGYPFLRSHSITFITEHHKSRINNSPKTQRTTYKIRIANQTNQDTEYRLVYRLMLGGYAVVVGGLGWIGVFVVQGVRSRRSTKIVI